MSQESNSGEARPRSRTVSLKSADTSTTDEEDDESGPPGIPEDEDLSREDIGAYRLDTSGFLGPDFEHLRPWGPIRPSSAAAKIWDKEVDNIVRLLNGEKLPWNAVHLGVLDNLPAVAIGFEKNGIQDWDTETHIIKKLRAEVLPKEIFPLVELFETKVRKGSCLGAGDYSRIATCGASIGVGGLSWSAGTVGGFLEDEAEIDGGIYGLTCHHVLLPTKASDPRDDPKRQGRETGIDYPAFLDKEDLAHPAVVPSSDKLTAITVVQPACGAHLDTVEAWEGQKTSLEEHLIKVRKKYEMSHTIASEKTVNHLEIQILDVSRELEKISDFARHFGTVVATSGYEVDSDSRHSLDWGLFRLSDDRYGMNELKKSIPGAVWKSFKPGQGLRGIADPVEGEEVAKIGAKTNLTFGRINGVKDTVNIRENGMETREICVVSRGRGRPFSEHGDSGSFVFNTKFEVVGMITAGCELSDRLTYITPIRLVLKDIERKLGKEFQLA
ncbi:hypothetical protein TWF696_007438 [Orbilia brochopaga]|uniref:Uncharacterized protein n=1 Tax=Orbilia brochopaga TaxID=3140254 RepID=A0AAV9URB7_9PEZI